jgi:hypothetical protein
MDMGLVVWGAVSASIGSFITGYILKLTEHRRELRSAGPLEVDRKRHLDRYETVKLINGLGRGLYHQVLHPVNGIDPEGIRHYAPRMRNEARSNVEVVGERYVTAVTRLTDIALRIADLADKYPASRDVRRPIVERIGLLNALEFEGAWENLIEEGVELLK